MNPTRLLDSLSIDRKSLDSKKEQTSYKIDFIAAYIEKWLFVTTNSPQFDKLVFIDCMCNAGVYADDDFGTPIRVLRLFQEAAIQYPNKEFHLVFNDYDIKRIAICESIIGEMRKEEVVTLNNLTTCLSCLDVNEFVSNTELFDKLIQKRTAAVLFVDPYDAVTVKTPVLKSFVTRYYCEVIYNFFSSDFIRNQDSERIIKYLTECFDVGEFSTIEEAEKLVLAKIKTGHISHSFAYAFRNVKNAELYRIIYLTPHIRGLEKLKEALWDVFKGEPFHRNKTNTAQASLFEEADDKAMLLEFYAHTATELLLQHFSGKMVTYSEIESFLMENTMMMGTQIINNILKPLVASGKLVKHNLAGNKQDYKKDSYTFA